MNTLTASSPYVLIRLWGHMMGSQPGYVDGEVARARRAGAPQTATFVRAGTHANRDLPHWVDPTNGEVWALWHDDLPASTASAMRSSAAACGLDLDEVLAAARRARP